MYKSIKDQNESITKLSRVLDLLQDEIIVMDLMQYAQSDGAKTALWRLKKLLSYQRRKLNDN